MSELAPNQIELILPISKSVVIIKEMITGAEREMIETAQGRVARIGDNNAVVADVAKIITAEKHATLDVYIISIDGSPTECRERLYKLFEPDTKFVVDAIEELQKKTASQLND